MKDNRYQVFFDDGTTEKLYDETIIKYNLLVNKDNFEQISDEVMKENGLNDAYYKGLNYIMKRLRTEKEVYDYLSKDYEKVIVDDVVNKLRDNNFFDEDVYIKAYVNDQVNLSQNGPYKIVDSLKKLGFEEKKINNYLAGIDDDVWQEKLRKLVEKKISGNHQYSLIKLKEKLYYDLMNLGYEKEMINREVNNVSIDNSNDILLREYEKQYRKLSKKFAGQNLRYQLKMKLLAKGFSSSDIEELIDSKME